MATGGMGDVLTGVCAGLAGQGLSLYDAARLGAWVCGRAAEIAVFREGQSEQSLLPGDDLDHLGDAFNDLHTLVVSFSPVNLQTEKPEEEKPPSTGTACSREKQALGRIA